MNQLNNIRLKYVSHGSRRLKRRIRNVGALSKPYHAFSSPPQKSIKQHSARRRFHHAE